MRPITTLALALVLSAVFNPTTALADEAGYMILWDLNPANCTLHTFTGNGARELAAQDVQVLRSLQATLAVAQADMSASLVGNPGQTEWFYTSYGEAMGRLTQMNMSLAQDIAELDKLALSFAASNEPLRGRDQRRAQRACRQQAELLNAYSGLWVDVATAAATIARDRHEAHVASVPWRQDYEGLKDREVVNSQFASLNDLPEPPACLDDLDRRLRDYGFDCVDR